jgi:hypothetical protein
MTLSVEIPDDLVSRLNAVGGDLSRRALEAFALEEYRSGRLTKAELRRLLQFETRFELDGFLKTHQVWADDTIESLRQDVRDLEHLGL